MPLMLIFQPLISSDGKFSEMSIFILYYKFRNYWISLLALKSILVNDFLIISIIIWARLTIFGCFHFLITLDIIIDNQNVILLELFSLSGFIIYYFHLRRRRRQWANFFGLSLSGTVILLKIIIPLIPISSQASC